MTDLEKIADLEKRTENYLNRIRAERELEKSKDYFREKKEQEAKKEAREKAEAEQLKAGEKRWNPYLEKAMKKLDEENEKYYRMVN